MPAPDARLKFLDGARCLAIVMMVLAHVRDGLMSPAHNEHWLARLHDGTRGLTAPLFFIVSGWAFAVATLPRFALFKTFSGPLRARLERIVTLFVVGHLLTLPWWHESFPFDVPRHLWLPFTTSGVLECLAAAMLVTHALVWLLPTRRAFTGVSLVLVVAAAVLAAPVQHATAGWPLVLKGPFNADGVGGGFPLAPFAAYFWLGTVLGQVRLPDKWLALAGALTLAAGKLIGPLFSAERFGPRMVYGSPGLFLTRVGWALLLIAAVAYLHRALPERFSLEKLGARGLTFYVAHMMALWGVPFVPGLVFRMKHAASVEDVIIVTLGMLVGIGIYCAVADRLTAAVRLTRRAATG